MLLVEETFLLRIVAIWPTKAAPPYLSRSLQASRTTMDTCGKATHRSTL